MPDRQEVARIEVSIHIPLGLDPDVATIHAPSRTPNPTEAPDQLSFDDPLPSESIPTDTQGHRRVASGVPITPQTTSDQKTEINETSERNEHLVELDTHFSSYRSRKSELERAKGGYSSHKYSTGEIARLGKNMKADQQAAKQEFAKACGSCALDCQIRDQYPSWARVHNQADGTPPAGQESRRAWRRRLLADPEAPCLPPKQKK